MEPTRHKDATIKHYETHAKISCHGTHKALEVDVRTQHTHTLTPLANTEPMKLHAPRCVTGETPTSEEISHVPIRTGKTHQDA